MARICRHARARDVPPEAILERRAAAKQNDGPRLTRRQFIAGAAAGVAALALPHRTFAGGGRSPSRIAIVGAGISGLNCALALADAGVRATVYEASPRLGGRMYSNNAGYWSGNQVSEWGGELIDTDHETIQDLATRFGLPLDDLAAAPPAGSADTYFFGHKYYPLPELLADFQPVLQAVWDDSDAAGYPTTYNSSTVAGRALDSMSIHEWIDRRVPGGHGSKMGQLLDTAYSIEYGADTRVQSALNLVYLLSGSDEDFEIFGASDERFHIRGGNQRLPLAIAAHLAAHGMPVQTGMRLTSIGKRADGTTRLIFETNGACREVIADAVVLTLPFAVLRTLDYRSAGFDALKKRAIDQLGRGHNGKLQLQFSRRLWNSHGPWGQSTGSTYADTGYQATWDVTRAQPGATGILVDYTGGSVTDRRSATVPFAFDGNGGVRRDASAFLRQIAPVFPGLPSLWNGKATSSLPHLSPFFNCSYSFWRVGQYRSFSGYEAAPQGNIFFAGEHTSTDYQGFMEGGAAEGARAAGEVLAQLGVAH
jgi:monoamine oxidase